MSTMGYVTTLTGAEDAASLSLDFEKQNYRVMEGGKLVNKQFSDLITFLRYSRGGRFNDKGLYELLEAHQPRFDYDPITKLLKGLLVEEQRTNLATFSNDMRLWNRTRVSLKQNAVVAPDGSLSGVKLVSSTVVDWHYVSSPLFSVANATQHFVSVYAKAGEWPRIRLSLLDSNVFAGATTFDLTTGTRVSGTSGEIVPVGNGWYRCTMTSTSRLAGNSGLSINPVKAGEFSADTAGDGVGGIYIWGGQVEVAASVTSYIPSLESFTSRASTATYFDSKGVLTTAGVDVPRTGAYEYDATGKLLPIGTLYEQARVNLLRDSNHFRGIIWNRAGGVVTSTDDTKSPDGTVATRVDLTGVDAHNINQSLLSPLAAVPHTLSIWVKARVGAFNFQLAYYGDGISQNATSIVPTGEWTRYTFTFTPLSATVATPQIRIVGFANGAPGDSFYIFGAQLEVDSVATSYVPSLPTFTGRASTATYFDVSGVLQTALVNVPRDNAFAGDGTPIGLMLENSATNLYGATENLGLPGSGWGRQSVAVAASGTVSPTGVGFYDEITINNSAGTPALNRDISSQPAGIMTQSFHVKSGTTDKCALRFYDTVGEGGRATFDLTTGTIQASQGAVLVSATINKLKGGGYRVSLTCDYTTRSRAGLLVYLIPDFNAPAVGKSILAWGAQLEAGKEVTSYIPSIPKFASRASTATYIDSTGLVKSAAVNVERTETYGRASNGSLVRVGTLLEGVSTNLIPYSNVTGGSWGNVVSGAATMLATPNGATAPDGTMTATKIDYGPKAAGESQLRRFQFTGLTDGSVLSNSIWLRADSPTSIMLRLGNGSAGLVEVSVGTEWALYKTASGTNASTSYNYELSLPASSAFPVGRTIYAWGAQLEVNHVHTSTILTSGAAGTRAADVFTTALVTRAADVYTGNQATRAADVTTSVATTRAFDAPSMLDISPWYKTLEGTTDVTFTPGTPGVGGTSLAFYMRSTANAAFDIIASRLGSSGAVVTVVADGTGATQVILDGATGISAGTRVRAVTGLKKDNFAFSVNGRGSLLDNTGTMPNPQQMRFGNNGNNSQSTNGYINKFNYYPLRLSNSQIEVLSNQ